MPAIFNKHAAHALTRTTIKLVRRDDDGNGGLKKSTIIGITIGLICFITTLVSFWFIWRLRRKLAPRTEEDDFREESLGRWMVNVLSPSRPSQRLGGHLPRDPPDRARRTSNSTFSTNMSRKESKDGGGPELSRSAEAHVVSQ